MFAQRAALALLVAAPLTFAGCAGGWPKAQEPGFDGARWAVVTTEHFRIFSDLDGDDLEELALRLERDLAMLASVTFRHTDPAVQATDVIVFAHEDDFRRYYPEPIGGVSAPGIPLLEESHHTIVTYEGFGPGMGRTLRHELVHDLFARNFGPAPPWLNEGFAEYYSTVEAKDGQILVGKSVPGVAIVSGSGPLILADGALGLPLEMIPPPSALLKMDRHEFYDHGRHELDGSTPSASRYFGAWALVHFLMDADGPYGRRFDRFLQAVRTQSVEGAWREAFAGVSSADLDAAFRSFLRTGELSIATQPLRVRPLPQPSSRRLEDSEKHVTLAKVSLLSRLPKTDAQRLFRRHVTAAIQNASPSAEGYYLRGLDQQTSSDTKGARQDFEQALGLAPNDPRFLRVALKLDLQTQASTPAGQDLAPFRSGVELLAQHAASPPDFFFAARYFAATGLCAQSLELAEQGVARNPTSPWVLREYAQIQSSCGTLERALHSQRRALEFLREDLESERVFKEELEHLEAMAIRARNRIVVQPLH